MAIFSLGSINADFFYYVDRLPEPGETLAANEYARGLGGKGANQSIAAALAGSDVRHIGAVGDDGDWAIEAMADRGVGTASILRGDQPTGNATIIVDTDAENVITLYPGANATLGVSELSALDAAKPGDILLLQNEVNLSAAAAERGKSLGMTVLYSAAPFEVTAVKAVLPHIDMLLLNAVEHEQLTGSLGDVDVSRVLITRGADGADLIEAGETTHVPAVKVDPIDTTGAGDCFAGYLAAGFDQGMDARAAMELAAKAAALKVTRRGTSDAFPSRAEVDAFKA